MLDFEKEDGKNEEDIDFDNIIKNGSRKTYIKRGCTAGNEAN
jgi:hypothetical protein